MIKTTNKELLTRFELFVGNEAQNVGFLRGLEDTGLSDDLQSALEYPFCKELTVPDRKFYKSNKNDKVINSFFTNSGLNKFKDAIDSIVNEIYEDGLYTVGKIELDSGINSETYRDEYQVLLEVCNLNDITCSVVNTNPGTYKFLKENNRKSLFFKYNLEETQDTIDKSSAIKVYPDCLDEDTYYYIDFENSLVEINKK